MLWLLHFTQLRRCGGICLHLLRKRGHQRAPGQAAQYQWRRQRLLCHMSWVEERSCRTGAAPKFPLCNPGAREQLQETACQPLLHKSCLPCLLLIARPRQRTDGWRCYEMSQNLNTEISFRSIRASHTESLCAVECALHPVFGSRTILVGSLLLATCLLILGCTDCQMETKQSAVAALEWSILSNNESSIQGDKQNVGEKGLGAEQQVVPSWIFTCAPLLGSVWTSQAAIFLAKSVTGTAVLIGKAKGRASALKSLLKAWAETLRVGFIQPHRAGAAELNWTTTIVSPSFLNIWGEMSEERGSCIKTKLLQALFSGCAFSLPQACEQTCHAKGKCWILGKWWLEQHESAFGCGCVLVVQVLIASLLT